MEVRTASLGIVALVVAGVGAVVVYGFDLESVKNDVRKQRAEIASIQETIYNLTAQVKEHRTKVDASKARAEEANKELSILTSLEKEVPEQEAALAEVKKKWQDQVDRMTLAVARGREKCKDIVIPEIPLKNGKSLKNCKVVLGKDGAVNLAHSDGIARLPASMMPPDLADKLRPDWKPLLNMLADPQATVVAAAPPVTAPIQEVAPQLSSTATDEERAKVKQIQEKLDIIAKLRSGATAAELSMGKYMGKYYDHMQKYDYARLMGRSSSQSSLATEAKAEADRLRTQAYNAYDQIAKLESEISVLRNF